MLKPTGKAPSKGWAAIEEGNPTKPYGTFYWNESGEIVKDNLRGDNSKIIMDRALPFIEQSVKQKEPLFCVIWFHTPHLPVVAGPRYRKMYSQYDLYHSNYYGCITAMDEQVGRLRASLKQLNAAENTMLWFCSDNGPEGNTSAPGSAGPFRGRKRDLLEGGIRVPALLEWPTKIRPDTETSFPMVTSDYLPTILSAVGLPAPTDRPVDGINLWPVFENKLKHRSQPIGFQYRNDAAWITDRYKLLRTKKKPRIQLFDLLNDPGETNDLSQAQPTIVVRLQTELDRWIKSCEQSNQGRDY